VAGVRSEVLGSAELEADELPDGRGVVVLERLRLAAGDAVPAFAGPVLLAVDRGRLAGEVEAGSVVVGGRGTPGTPVATTGGFAVDASGAVFFPDGMAETAPLGGDGEAIVLRLGVVPLPLADAVSDGAAEASAATNEPTGAEEDGADGFAPGSRVVVAVDEARLRAEPSLAGALVVGLDGGRVLVVTGEPTAVDGYRWYRWRTRAIRPSSATSRGNC
jgi:hypothetical protein